MKNQYCLESYSLKEGGAAQQLKSSSWIIIENDLLSTTKVIFFNNDEVPDSEKFSSFQEFFDIYVDDNLRPHEDYSRHCNDSKGCATGVSCHIEQEYSSRKGAYSMDAHSTIQTIDAYNGLQGLTLEQLVAQSKQDALWLERSTIEATKDSTQLARSPHDYYGVSPGDF